MANLINRRGFFESLVSIACINSGLKCAATTIEVGYHLQLGNSTRNIRYQVPCSASFKQTYERFKRGLISKSEMKADQTWNLERDRIVDGLVKRWRIHQELVSPGLIEG